MSDIVSLDKFREKSKNKPKREGTKYDFASLIKRNQSNEERLKRERACENKKVIRSHRLK